MPSRPCQAALNAHSDARPATLNRSHPLFMSFLVSRPLKALAFALAHPYGPVAVAAAVMAGMAH